MGIVRLTWKDNNLYEDGHRIYRSQSPMDIENLPEPIADLGNGVTAYDDGEVSKGDTYYYLVSSYYNNEEKYSDELKVSLDFGIGSDYLIGGDLKTEGFFGEVPVSELFSGDELASLIGLSEGTSQHSNDPWLKFIIDGEIIYVAKKPYRHSISWNHINSVNAVYNDENAPIVEKDGYQFKVTLMTGASSDPYIGPTSGTNDPAYSQGSEWNRLMYRVHEGDPSGDPWVRYTDDDIGINGARASWMQETPNSDNSRRVYRSAWSLLQFDTRRSGDSGTTFRWRPVLRLDV